MVHEEEGLKVVVVTVAVVTAAEALEAVVTAAANEPLST